MRLTSNLDPPDPAARRLSRRSFLKLALVAVVDSALLATGGWAYASQIEPGWVKVTNLELVLPKLPSAFHGYRIAQISDIHMGTWMTRERLADAITRVNLHYPDLVVITGDFVHLNPELYLDDLILPLQQLHAKDGVLAVLGNHDHWTNSGLVREILKTARITDLSNRVHILERDGKKLNIAGVDDIWERQDRLDLVLNQLPLEGTAILLAHEPDFADTSTKTRRFDLQLSGHSHGGQVILPFVGAPIVPPYGQKYPSGLYRVDLMFQYTNRGIGMISPTIRFNCRPEVTLLTLYSPQVTALDSAVFYKN